jgi:hypothetical protein
MGVTRIVLETGCSRAVSKLGSGELDRLVHGPLVEDIKTLLQGFDEFKVQHVRRTANVVAHKFSKEGCKNKLCHVWVGVPPSML